MGRQYYIYTFAADTYGKALDHLNLHKGWGSLFNWGSIVMVEAEEWREFVRQHPVTSPGRSPMADTLDC